MTTQHETIQVIRVRLAAPFNGFYVQIEPTERFFEEKRYYDLILKDDLSCCYYFGSNPSNDIDEVIQDAKILALHAIHDHIEEMFPWYYDPDDEEDCDDEDL